jgi:peptidoglycan hydrolase-like protein with peptidoglycan-binding domain
MSRGRTMAVVAAAVAIAAVSAALVVTRHSGTATQTATNSPATSVVQRTSLTSTQQFNGTLGYYGSYRIAAPGTSRGVVTWLPQQGAVITRGHQVYGVDGHPAVLFYGAVPLWRTLELGVSDGPDVAELNRNLMALGFGSWLTSGDEFTAATAGAIEEWQASLGLPQTGAVSPGDVVIEPGAIRIGEVSATLGGTAGDICTASSTQRTVTVSVPVSQEQLAGLGSKVSVQLPGGVVTTGRVSQVGNVAQPGTQPDTAGVSQANQGDQALQNATIQVRVTMDRPGAAGPFETAPAVVSFTSQTVHDVLVVPVTALLARPDGSYAVAVVSQAPSHSTIVPVRLGMFAGGEVQVSGAWLSAGMRVEVPGQ